MPISDGSEPTADADASRPQRNARPPSGDASTPAGDNPSRLLAHVVDHLPQGIALHDKEGRLLYLNQAAALHFGPDNLAYVMAATPAGAATDGGSPASAAPDPSQFEHALITPSGRRDFVVSRKAIHCDGRDLLLTSASDITAQTSREAQLIRLAYFDELTDLPNRRVIEDRVNAAIRRHGSAGCFALAFIDLDHFKQINDYYGHAIGDALLSAFSQRIKFYLRETDVLARISGDEFLLLLDPVRNQDEVEQFFGVLLQKLKAPYVIDNTEVFGSLSAGVALYPEHGQNYETLSQSADIAMYSVKTDTRGAFAFFDHSMESEAQDRIKTEQSLRLAIQDRQFVCAFQPKVDIRTQEVKGVEALVRLRNDSGVIQAPGAFVDLAVELGLIDSITHLVLDEIISSIDLINQTFGCDASISINVAAKQAVNVSFMESFARALEATEYAERFIIEVTEDAFITKTKFQMEIVPLLRRIGVGISIDDFGIGYSSLSALADITADEIKIDRSFITDIHKRPRSQGILKAIESLSEALGMTVIAEGVESFEELAYLQAATRIRYAQGYYFSQPVFLDEIRKVHGGPSATADLTSRRPQDTRATQRRSIGGRG